VLEWRLVLLRVTQPHRALVSGVDEAYSNAWLPPTVATKFSNLREAASVSFRYIRLAHTDNLPPFVRSGGFET
jgi:hypothetical protein